MLRENNIIYGTLRECTDELFNEIHDFSQGNFPDFDFVAIVDEDATSVKEALDSAESWFGCKDMGSAFNTDTISLMFAHYGGGGIESMELNRDDDFIEDAKEEFMARIASSTERCGFGALEPDDYTVFAIQ